MGKKNENKMENKVPPNIVVERRDSQQRVEMTFDDIFRIFSYNVCSVDLSHNFRLHSAS